LKRIENAEVKATVEKSPSLLGASDFELMDKNETDNSFKDIIFIVLLARISVVSLSFQESLGY